MRVAPLRVEGGSLRSPVEAKPVARRPAAEIIQGACSKDVNFDRAGLRLVITEVRLMPKQSLELIKQQHTRVLNLLEKEDLASFEVETKSFYTKKHLFSHSKTI